MADCDVPSLLQYSGCLDCLSPGSKATVEIALLMQIAGVSDVQTLLDRAACFDCLSAGEKSTVETQLLCNWSS